MKQEYITVQEAAARVLKMTTSAALRLLKRNKVPIGMIFEAGKHHGNQVAAMRVEYWERFLEERKRIIYSRRTRRHR